MSDPPPIAEELVCALIVALMRRGVIHPEDFDGLPQPLTEEAARVLDALAIEAVTPSVSQADFAAEKRRATFRVVD